MTKIEELLARIPPCARHIIDLPHGRFQSFPDLKPLGTFSAHVTMAPAEQKQWSIGGALPPNLFKPKSCPSGHGYGWTAEEALEAALIELECAQAEEMRPPILYHGTSKARFQKIMAEGALLCADVGVPVVCTSRSLKVAEYWASLAAQTDGREGRGDGTGVVLALDWSALDGAGFLLVNRSDPIWGDGECDWEEEVSCWSDIPDPRRFVIETRVYSKECLA